RPSRSGRSRPSRRPTSRAEHDRHPTGRRGPAGRPGSRRSTRATAYGGPDMRTPAVRRPGRLVPLLLLAVVAFVWACAVPAAAHDVLVASDPADGATLDAPPDRVVLSFSAEQMPLGHAFEVLDPDGVDHVVGEPAVDGRDLVQELDGLGPAGTWTVAWRSVASDGHPVSGTFAFTATNPAPDDG